MSPRTTHSDDQQINLGGAISLKAFGKVSSNLVNTLKELNEEGLTWSSLSVMRGVCRLELRIAGAPQSAGRKGPCVGGFRLTSVLSDGARRLELTYALALYKQFDAGRTDDDMLLDSKAMLYAWRAFVEAVPDHEINILHLWSAGRALLQRKMSLTRCPECAITTLKHTLTGSTDLRGLTADDCFVCTERRRDRTKRTRGRRGRMTDVEHRNLTLTPTATQTLRAV